VFGLGFSEMILILIVGIVVVGPRNLPTLMRTAGRWVTKLRRMSSELRTQSGIDDLIRQEGLEKELHELRALSRVNVIDTLMAPAMGAAATVAKPKPQPKPAPVVAPVGDEPDREREYPVIGCDAYEALPDDASPYPGGDTPPPGPEPKPKPEPVTPAKIPDPEPVVAAPVPVGTPQTPANGTGT
jgi:sec-independent protein translocase protein TatB